MHRAAAESTSAALTACNTYPLAAARRHPIALPTTAYHHTRGRPPRRHTSTGGARKPLAHTGGYYRQ